MRGDVAVALSVITYVGLIISLLCLTLFIVTYLSEKYVIYQLPLRSIVSTSTSIKFRKLRTNIHGQILVNMSLALIGLYVFFLIGGHVTSIPVLCGISSALLQYFILAFFGWTAVEAVWLYLKLVKVFGTSSFTSKFTLKSGLPTWSKYLLKEKHVEPLLFFLSALFVDCHCECCIWLRILCQFILVGHVCML